MVTDLTNKLMPFIRYDQGDLAVFHYGQSVTGRRSRRLKQILGRESDYAVFPDGTRRSEHHFITILHEYEGIDQFRVVQRTPGLFRILIVADPAYFESIHDDLVSRFHESSSSA